MPYIKKEKRGQFKKPIDEISKLLAADEENIEGNMNYIISRLFANHLRFKLNYKQLNAMVGMLECCKMELYRKMAAPYENEKCKENGEAYE